MNIIEIKSSIKRWKNKKVSYTLNLIAYILAIVCFIVIFKYLNFELNFDRHHKNYKQIFRITSEIIMEGEINATANTDRIIAPLLVEDFPEIKSVARFQPLTKTIVRRDNILLYESKIYYANHGALDVFNYTVIEGDISTALKEPSTIVITESFKNRYFSDESPLGEIFEINGVNYRIDAVLANLPENSDFRFDALIYDDLNSNINFFEDVSLYTYIQFKHKEDINTFDDKLKTFVERHYDEFFKSLGIEISMKLKLEQISDVHFSQGLIGDTIKGNRLVLYILIGVAFIIILIASINYIIFSLMTSESRKKEIGVKKILGQSRSNIIKNFVIESFIFIIFSFSLSMIILLFLEHVIVNYLHINTVNFNVNMIFILIGISLLSAIISAIYPSIRLSSFIPLTSLINKSHKKTNSVIWIMICFQFSIAIFLVFSSLVVSDQISYMINSQQNLKTDDVLVIKIPSNENEKSKAIRLRDNLLQIPLVNGASLAGAGSELNSDEITKVLFFAEVDSFKIRTIINQLTIDKYYIPLLNINIKKGRNFNESYTTDLKNGIIVNEKFLNTMRIKNPIDKEIDRGAVGRIIGVTDDFHFASLHNEIEPLVIRFIESDISNLFVKINSDQVHLIKNEWEKVYEGYPFDYYWMEDYYNSSYSKELKNLKIFIAFSILAIVIAIIGIYSFSNLELQSQLKEISLRLVFGISNFKLFMYLVKKFVVLIIVSILMGISIGYMLVGLWLDNFAYHVSIGAEAIIISSLIVAIVVFLAIVSNVIRAVRTNPSVILKDE